MEAVPRLPMLSFDLKSSTESPSFGPKLKQYIRDFYNEDPEMYSNEIHNLEGVRAQAVCAVRNATGCQALKRYYCQLHFLQSRFPMAKEGAAAVSFTWQDTYTSMVCTLADIRFEMVCILYNIGALHSQLGASDSRVSPNGMKMCCTHFQCAAWAFQHLKDTYPQPAGVDLAPNVMQFMYQLTLAQAQECILEKSMMDNRKATIIAKVAVQVVDYYNQAMNVLEHSGSDECSVGDTVGSKLYKNWKRYVKFKTVYHSALSLLYHGQQAEEQQKMGERVAFYQAASDRLKEAMKLSKGMDEVEAVNEALAFTMDVIEGKKKAAKNENEFIYHEVVPDRDTLQEVKGASLVQGISFDVNDMEISGPDIFSRLVPMKAHEASSLYSEEKAKLRRKVGAMIDEKDEQLNRFMNSLQLDHLNSVVQQDEIPQELVDRCAALNAKPDAIPSLSEAMNKLADVSIDVESMLQDVKVMLEMEEQKEKEYQDIMGKRPPSIAATDLTRESRKYQEAHSKASESNQTLHKAMMLHIPNLRNLSVPLADLQKLIPTVTIQTSPADEAVIKRLQLLVSKVDEMRQQRSMLANSLRTATSRDDITTQLVTRTSDSLDTIFDQEMQKHQRIVATIEQNLAAQDNILKEITEVYPLYITMRKETDEKLRGRRTLINSLIASYDAYEDLLAKSGKGLEFYRKLETNVNKLLQRVKGTVRVQDEEREQFLAKNMKTIPSVPKAQLPTESVTNKGGPKLKDYLQSMKMGQGQVAAAPAANYPTSSVPYYPPASYPPTVSPVPTPYYDPSTSSDSGSASQWVPSIRPAPVGQEGSEQTASACYVSNDTKKPATSTTPQHSYSSYGSKTSNSQGYYNIPAGQYAGYTPVSQTYPVVSTPGYSYNNNQASQQYQSLPAASYSAGGAAVTSQPQNPVPSNPPYNINSNLSGQNYSAASPAQSNQYPSSASVSYSALGQGAYNPASVVQGSQGYTAGYNAPSAVHSGQTYNQQNTVQGNQSYSAAESLPYNQVQSNQTYSLTNAAPSVQGYSMYQATSASTNMPQSVVYPASSQQYPDSAAAVSQAPQNYPSYNQQSTPPANLQYPQGSYSTVGGQSSVSTQQVTYPAQQQVYNSQQKQYPSSQPSSALPSQNQVYYQQTYPQTSTPQLASSTQYSAPIPPTSQTNSYSGHPGYSYNSATGQYDYTSGYQAGGQASQQNINAPAPATWPQSYGQDLNAKASVAATTADPPQQYGGQQYTSAGNNYTTSSQSSLNQAQYSAEGYNQGNYYSTQYGYQVGTSGIAMPPPSPQMTGHSSQQATYMHAGSPSVGTMTTRSQAAVTSSSSLDQVGDGSNIDLLAGLDFNVNVTPLMPQTIVEKPKQPESPKKVNGDKAGELLSRGPTLHVEEKLNISSGAVKSEVSIPIVFKSQEKKTEIPPSIELPEDNKLLSKVTDPYTDPDALSQFVQEVEKYEKFVEGLTTKTLNGPTPLDMKWKELNDLQEKDANRHSISVARCYPMKNRFPDILPYDDSRVELPSTKDDYINASYVRDLTPLTPPFIMTQAPLPSTYTDFWTMVWEQQVEVIVCLLSDAELQEQAYWPVDKNQEVAAGKMRLTLQSADTKPHWTERIISLCLVESRATRVIVHLQFTAWPGSSFPASPGPFLGFVSEALNYYSQQRGAGHPMAVHCLSGVGRSGLFCLTAAALCEIQAGRGLLELVQVTARMSTARKAALRDREHLKFAYQAMLYYAQDMLMKRGILTSRSTFEDKRSRGSKGHTRHPSEDFLLGPPTDLSQLQSGIEKMGLAAANKAPSSCEKSANPESLDSSVFVSKPSHSNSSICSSVSSSGRSSPLGHSMSDMSRGRQDTSKKRYTRDSFTSSQSSLDVRTEVADDPLSMLDPLWRMK